MRALLIRNGRGRVRCYWHRVEPRDCSMEGWSMFWEYLLDEDGDVAVCYNHSDEPRKAYVLELKKRTGRQTEETG